MRHSLISLLIFTFLACCFSSDRCYHSKPPTERNQFPNRTFLTSGESMSLRMKDYFTGVNLTFSYSIGDGAPKELSKIRRSDGFDKDLLRPIFNMTNTTNTTNTTAESDDPPVEPKLEVKDIYWDDSNVTDLNQKWGSESNVMMLIKYENDYYILGGSLLNIAAAQNTESETKPYNLAKIAPPEGFTIEEFHCSFVERVGNLKYYVQCFVKNEEKKSFRHYFYYVQMDGFPPSTTTVQIFERPFSGQVTSFNLMDIVTITNVAVEDKSYLLICYNVEGENRSGNIEIFDVTRAEDPRWKTLYSSKTDKMFENFPLIQYIAVSPAYLYIAARSENLTILQNWHNPEKIKISKVYRFDSISFKEGSLRVVNSVTGTKESLIMVGTMRNANLFAFHFVSQVYLGFYTVPLPNIAQKTLRFKTMSLSLGEDFFAISYSVSDLTDFMCYYFAVIDITSNLANDCHTLWVSNDKEYVSYVKMNPSPNTDTLFLIRNNNTFTHLAASFPHLTLYNQMKSSNITLNIGEKKYGEFQINMLPAGDMSVYLNTDKDAPLYKNIIQRGSQAYLYLNSSVYAPKLDFKLLNPSHNLAFSVHTSRKINFVDTAHGEVENTTLLAARRKKVPTQSFLLIEKSHEGEVIFKVCKSATLENNTISKIAVKKSASVADFNVTNYFYANTYDIFLLEDEGVQSLSFCKIDRTIDAPENHKCVNTTDYVIYGQKKKVFQDVNIIERSLTETLVIGISDQTVYIDIWPGEIKVKPKRQLQIPSTLFKKGSTFMPNKTILHSAYPDTIFVTTEKGNSTYIIDYSPTFFLDSSLPTSITYVVVFTSHESTSYKDVIVQPFEKNLFYIFTKLNVIEHWDLSERKAPFFRRNLDLFSYNISVLSSEKHSYIKKGSAFSSTTDTLYLVAWDGYQNCLCVMILKPNIAYSYIVNSIPLAVNEEKPEDIYIDVSGTFVGAYGALLGDILTISIGKNTTIMQVYPTPYIAFPMRLLESSAANSLSLSSVVNQKYTYALRLGNDWSSNVGTPNLILSIFEDEKRLQLKSPSIYRLIHENTSNLTFGINDLFSGTVYDLNISKAETVHYNLTSFICNRTVTPFPANNVTSVLVMEKHTYYLDKALSTIAMVRHNDTSKFIFVIYNFQCQKDKLYIDNTETYGAIICQNDQTIGIRPFLIKKNDTQRLASLVTMNVKDYYIDGEKALLFLLIQNKDRSSINVYNLNAGFNLDKPKTVIQDWSLTKSNLQLEKFDIFYSKIHLIFTIDANFGLRIISYKIDWDYVEQISALSFAELYKNFPISPSSIKFSEVALIETNCDHSEKCVAKVILVASNFHSLLLQFDIPPGGSTIGSYKTTAFLVSSDYIVHDFQYSNNLLVLLARNQTQTVPSLDMVAYNISDNVNFSNNYNTLDQTAYKVPMWIQVLHPDYYEYLADSKRPLIFPSIFLQNNGSYEILKFPNLQTSKMETLNLTNKITLSWNSSLFAKNELRLGVFSHYQQLELPISLERPGDQASSFTWIYMLLFPLGFVALVIFCNNLYNKSKSKKIQYARRKQKDPLRELILEESSLKL